MATTTSSAEKRKHRRYDLSLDLEVKGRKRAQPIQTQTRDISARGLYFSFVEPLDVGSELNFELNLPPELSGGKDVRVRCRGRVVRVDTLKASQQIGVAATIETYEFVRGTDR